MAYRLFHSPHHVLACPSTPSTPPHGLPTTPSVSSPSEVPPTINTTASTCLHLLPCRAQRQSVAISQAQTKAGRGCHCFAVQRLFATGELRHRLCLVVPLWLVTGRAFSLQHFTAFHHFPPLFLPLTFPPGRQ
ncbi:hypothetical protein E2C01_000729 [Portunus trituberculatus]|uniref:Uncharacterized protein n=1 Tax=Portunus trituberculatus TaxID=210409 RepID=A0A5B7CHC7_PORTR|nr:hypothetical protein [Portunus trituberculatus]